MSLQILSLSLLPTTSELLLQPCQWVCLSARAKEPQDKPSLSPSLLLLTVTADHSQASVSSFLKLWSTTSLIQQFLNDYGLIWVGERHEQLEDLESLNDKEEWPARTLWKPGKAPALFAEAAILAPAACLEKVWYSLEQISVKDPEFGSSESGILCWGLHISPPQAQRHGAI